MSRRLFPNPILLLIALAALPARADVAGASEAMDAVIPPLMARCAIPGMAVGVTRDGRAQVFAYGVDSLSTRRPVSAQTLFEIGSVTKTFTATLAAYAAEKGALALSDPVGRFLPELQGSPFGAVSLVHLGTHTPGGLPLQVPDGVTTLDAMLAHFRAWRPAAAPGTLRTYSNPGVGAFGLAAARSLGRDFGPVLEDDLLPALGLRHTYLRVPAGLLGAYAQGYTEEGAPVRLTPGVFWEEGYGIRTTAGDLLRFLEENMGLARVGDPALGRALRATQTGYVRSGPLTQDLMWEQYPMPVSLETLLRGNSAEMLYRPTPAEAVVPPVAPGGDVWINKTGSTAGFGAYVAFLPRDRLGIVLLANKAYPIPERVRAAYAIVGRLKITR